MPFLRSCDEANRITYVKLCVEPFVGSINYFNVDVLSVGHISPPVFSPTPTECDYALHCPARVWYVV